MSRFGQGERDAISGERINLSEFENANKGRGGGGTAKIGPETPG